MKDKLKKIQKIANNILCYDDSSDFGTALWEILHVCNPKAEYDQLELIED